MQIIPDCPFTLEMILLLLIVSRCQTAQAEHDASHNDMLFREPNLNAA